MRVLVTGGAGFIGSNFVHYCLKHKPDWRVSVLDSLTYAGNFKNISSLVESEQISFLKIDIANAVQVEEAFSIGKFDLVFNLAAESHVDRSIHSASEFVRTNVLGTQILLNSAMEHGVKRFIHISTDEVYGSLGDEGLFLETTPLDPTSPYAASKTASDLMVLAACKTHNFDAVITRCTNNYGPFQFPEKLIPLFITNALEDKELPLYGDGMNVRSWLHVDDHSRAILLAAEKGRAGEVYNIGGDRDSEIPNVAVTKTILQLLKKPETLIKQVKDRPAHDRRYAVDFSKAHKELGWTPSVRFSDGIKETIDWYLENRQWWQDIKSGEYRKFYELNYSQRS